MSIVESNMWGTAKEEINNNALNKNGDSLLGDVDANGFSIKNIGVPQNDGDAVNVTWVKNWQPPWTYTEDSPHELLFPETEVSFISSSNVPDGNEISDISDGFYIINSGYIRIVCNAGYGTNDGYRFSGTFSVYKNGDLISSYNVARNQFGSSASTPKVIDIIIDVQKGDILKFGIVGDFSSSNDLKTMRLYSRSYVDIGNPYKYQSYESAIISSSTI